MLQPRFRKVLTGHRETRDYIRKRIAEHMDTFDEDNMRDFIDLYLKTEKRGATSDAMTGRNHSGADKCNNCVFVCDKSTKLSCVTHIVRAL